MQNALTCRWPQFVITVCTAAFLNRTHARQRRTGGRDSERPLPGTLGSDLERPELADSGHRATNATSCSCRMTSDSRVSYKDDADQRRQTLAAFILMNARLSCGRELKAAAFVQNSLAFPMSPFPW